LLLEEDKVTNYSTWSSSTLDVSSHLAGGSTTPP